jgi:hypothetical protein
MSMDTRKCLSDSLALTASLSTTPALAIENFASGEIFIPAASSITSLTFYVAPTSKGTFLAAYDAAGSAVTMTVTAERAYPLPAAIFGASSVKMVANTTGTVIYNVKS